MTTDEQPEWARLIDERRAAMRPKMSVRKAAEKAGISEGRWRQIVKGYQATSGGRIPVIGPAETVARMAVVVGVTAEELSAAGRPDAGAELATELERFPDSPKWAEDAMDIQAVWAELEAWMKAGEEEWPENWPPTSALMFWSSEQMLDVLKAREVAERRRDRDRVRVITERNATIDALREKLGWPPMLDNLRGSPLYKPIEAALRGPEPLEAVADDDDIDPEQSADPHA